LAIRRTWSRSPLSACCGQDDRLALGPLGSLDPVEGADFALLAYDLPNKL